MRLRGQEAPRCGDKPRLHCSVGLIALTRLGCQRRHGHINSLLNLIRVGFQFSEIPVKHTATALCIEKDELVIGHQHGGLSLVDLTYRFPLQFYSFLTSLGNDESGVSSHHQAMAPH